MAFLEDFDGTDGPGGNALLWDWILNKRDALFEELRGNRPVLKFWSLHPGNPDPPANDPAIGQQGWAYLLTKRTDVKKALSDFSMFPYKLSGKFILCLDNGSHGPKRKKLQEVIKAPDTEPPPAEATTFQQAIEGMVDQAVDKSWEKLVGDPATGAEVILDVRVFTRDVALQFTGKSFGIPDEKIFEGTQNLAKWSGDAYEDFIWKINGRHFVADRPNGGAGLVALQKIAALINAVLAASSGGDTIIGRLKEQSGPFDESHLTANIVGMIQGLIDNVMTGTCYAFNQFFQTGAALDAHNSCSDLPGLRQMMYDAHRNDTPGPFLPRRGKIADLPSQAGAGGEDVNFALAIGAALNDPDPDPDPGPDAWDIRMGWKKHRCIGRWIGDEIMVRTLARMLSLKDLEITDPLEKQWGWIVKKFSVKGTAP